MGLSPLQPLLANKHRRRFMHTQWGCEYSIKYMPRKSVCEFAVVPAKPSKSSQWSCWGKVQPVLADYSTVLLAAVEIQVDTASVNRLKTSPSLCASIASRRRRSLLFMNSWNAKNVGTFLVCTFPLQGCFLSGCMTVFQISRVAELIVALLQDWLFDLIKSVSLSVQFTSAWSSSLRLASCSSMPCFRNSPLLCAMTTAEGVFEHPLWRHCKWVKTSLESLCLVVIAIKWSYHPGDTVRQICPKREE